MAKRARGSGQDPPAGEEFGQENGDRRDHAAGGGVGQEAEDIAVADSPDSKRAASHGRYLHGISPDRRFTIPVAGFLKIESAERSRP